MRILSGIVTLREKKDLSFDDLAGPVEKMVIPQLGRKTN